MPRFLGHASTYLALLGMILVSAVVTFQGVQGSIKSKISDLAFSIRGVQASSSHQDDSAMKTDIADFVFQEDQQIVLPTFDENLLAHDEESSETPDKVGDYFAQAQNRGQHVSEKLSKK